MGKWTETLRRNVLPVLASLSELLQQLLAKKRGPK